MNGSANDNPFFKSLFSGVSMSQIVQIIKVVEEARKHIDFPVPSDVTFFSTGDIWDYQSVMDDRRCEACSGHEETGSFRGNDLHTAFPNLEIRDQDLIYAHVHLNCRCYLTRSLKIE